MNKKKYIIPQSIVVFCEKGFLAEDSEWTDEAFGKETTIDEESWDDGKEDNNSDTYNRFGYNRFEYDRFGYDRFKEE